MKFAMCNEFCENWALPDVFALAAECGYEGIELAPFTLDSRGITHVTPARRRELRQQAAAAGLAIAGFHWLLTTPPGLYVNHPDDAIRRTTRDYFVELIRACADLGGDRLVVGSPKQRDVLPGHSREAAWARTEEFYRYLGPVAADHGVVIALEPLSPADTNFLTTKDETVRLIEAIGHPAVRLILDCKAMASEAKPIPQLLREGAPWLAHVHVNDDTRSYPGTGSIDFPAVLATLVGIGYDGWVSLEVFDYTPGPATIAREAIAHLRRCLP